MTTIRLLFIFFLLFSSTANADANIHRQPSTRLEVVATFSILGDLVNNIAGDNIKLRVLVGAGSDAHIYQPNTDDVRALAGADLLIANGLGFESWLISLINSSAFDGALLTVGKSVDTLMVDSHHSSHFKVPDPHAWQDIANVIVYVELIAEKLCLLDVSRSHIYQQNAKNYIAQLQQLDQELRAFTDSLPDASKKLVTSHDSFGYFGRAYGLTFIAAQGVSTDAEARAQDVAALIRQIRRDNISALFVENIMDDRLLQQVSRETGAQIGGRLYSDSLSEADRGAPDYLSMMKHNLLTLRKALSKGVQ